MQLLTLDFLNIFGTAVVVPLILAAIATIIVRVGKPAGVSAGTVFFAIFAFSVLGFVAGKVMSNSRDSAVGAVLPAVLTLLGGVTVYVMGVKEARFQGQVSAMLLCFALSLFIGSHFGAQLRYDYEVFLNDPRLSARHDDIAEDMRLQLDLKRLSNYVTVEHLKKDFETKYGVQLTGFEHGGVAADKPSATGKKKPD